MDSGFAAWMERLYLEQPDEVTPDKTTDDLLLIFQKGSEHEAKYLEDQRRDHDVAEPSGHDETRTAMEEGADVIYQAALAAGQFEGYADFLRHVGDGYYEPVEVKLARTARPYAIIQLCAYAEMLEAIQGKRPEHIHVVLGDGTKKSYRTNDFFFYYLALKAEFLQFMRDWNADSPPEPDLGGEHGRWQSHVDQWLEDKDHLLRVANIMKSQIQKLKAAGIDTMAALAATTVTRVPKLDDRIFQKLKRQARLQVASAGLPTPQFEVLPHDEPGRGLAMLAPDSPGDVYFDMEGYPLVEGGLEYLLGATTPDGIFHDWWAHDAAEEKRAFEQFIDWVADRRRQWPDMHVYHYAHYEKTALTRLASTHHTREDILDDLLRNQVFVDLYRVVTQGLCVGTPSYSIKDIERLYRGERAGDVQTAAGSIVEYEHWRNTKDPAILEAIRLYNKNDCDSTLELAAWLRERQAEAKIEWRGAPMVEEPKEPEVIEARQQLEDELVARGDELMGHLVQFHRREAKPTYWAMYNRAELTEDQLYDDFDCLAGLARDGEPEPVKRSTGCWYRFNPAQDTKVRVGKGYLVAHNIDASVDVLELDHEGGRGRLKFGPKAIGLLDGVPERLTLIPGEPVRTGTLAAAIEAIALSGPPAPLLQFLERTPPVIAGHERGTPLPQDAADLIPRMDGTYLCVQGPPGSGKTTAGARTILALLDDGKRVGITSNSHKAIENLMEACIEQAGGELPCLKQKKTDFTERYDCVEAIKSNEAADKLADTPLIGGTAWVFARDDMVGALDYLFVDEAGQVSLANLVAMSRCTRNLVLLGDQMQLGQPIQGSHPGDSGKSVLDYLLGDERTIPAELGIFLEKTWRLHPEICGLISDAVYEGRLESGPNCVRRVVKGGGEHVPVEAGIVFVPVWHEGNTQGSAEEVDVVEAVARELVGRERTGLDGEVAGRMELRDVLFVAPYNLQVRGLAERLGDEARVGSVDRFQGQQAPAVVLSMCASDGAASARGIEFLFDLNRLNVALSRAQSLAVVVGNPGLAHTPCATLKQMRLVNLFARVVGGG